MRTSGAPSKHRKQKIPDEINFTQPEKVRRSFFSISPLLPSLIQQCISAAVMGTVIGVKLVVETMVFSFEGRVIQQKGVLLRCQRFKSFFHFKVFIDQYHICFKTLRANQFAKCSILRMGWGKGIKWHLAKQLS